MFLIWQRSMQSGAYSGLRVITSRLQNISPSPRWFSGGLKRELLYEHLKSRHIMMVRILGFSQFVFWPYMYFAVHDLLEKKKLVRRNPAGDSTTMESVCRSIAESKLMNVLAASSAALGLLFGIVTTLIVRQSVKRIELIGRHNVLFETYGVIAPQKFESKLEHVSAAWGRHPTSKSFIPIKVSGRKIYLLIDQYYGRFPAPKMYDMSVGVTRQL